MQHPGGTECAGSCAGITCWHWCSRSGLCLSASMEPRRSDWLDLRQRLGASCICLHIVCLHNFMQVCQASGASHGAGVHGQVRPGAEREDGSLSLAAPSRNFSPPLCPATPCEPALPLFRSCKSNRWHYLPASDWAGFMWGGSSGALARATSPLRAVPRYMAEGFRALFPLALHAVSPLHFTVLLFQHSQLPEPAGRQSCQLALGQTVLVRACRCCKKLI